MSDRNVMLPDRALLQTLTNLNRRLMTAQRRARFPGAVFSKRANGSIALALSGLPTLVVPNSLIFLTLERGRWFLYGGNVMNGTPVAANAFAFATGITSPSMPWGETVATDSTMNIANPVSRPLAVVTTVSLEATTTFWLEARAWRSIAGTVTSTDAYLYAVPA